MQNENNGSRFGLKRQYGEPGFKLWHWIDSLSTEPGIIPKHHQKQNQANTINLFRVVEKKGCKSLILFLIQTWLQKLLSSLLPWPPLNYPFFLAEWLSCCTLSWFSPLHLYPRGWEKWAVNGKTLFPDMEMQLFICFSSAPRHRCASQHQARLYHRAAPQFLQGANTSALGCQAETPLSWRKITRVAKSAAGWRMVPLNQQNKTQLFCVKKPSAPPLPNPLS